MTDVHTLKLILKISFSPNFIWFSYMTVIKHLNAVSFFEIEPNEVIIMFVVLNGDRFFIIKNKQTKCLLQLYKPITLTFDVQIAK